MSIFIVRRSHIFVATLFLFMLQSSLFASLVVLENEKIIGKRAVDKINIIGAELQQKLGVNSYIVALQNLHKKPLVVYEKELANKLKKPYVLLSLSVDDQQVDIVCSDELKGKFDKDQILSPYPWSGTIIPLLTVKKGDDKYSAALLNGYADIVEQIASSYGVELKSAIGSANKNVLGIIRLIFYFSIGLVIVVWLYWRIKRRERKR